MGFIKNKNENKEKNKIEASNMMVGSELFTYVIPNDEKDGKNSSKSGELNASDIESYHPQQAEDRIRDIESDSDKGYQKIAERVVTISEDYLKKQDDRKKPLQESFNKFFTKLLGMQYIVMIGLFLLNSFSCIPFTISESLLMTYIVSVFVETLGAISVMLAFAFTSKEESNIVEVLNAVISNHQKYQARIDKKGDKGD